MVHNQFNIFAGNIDPRSVSDARGADDAESKPIPDASSENPQGFLPILMQMLPAFLGKNPSASSDAGDPVIGSPHEVRAVDRVQEQKSLHVERSSESFALIGVSKPSTPINENQSQARIAANDKPGPLLVSAEELPQEPTKLNSPDRTNGDGSLSSNVSPKTTFINTIRNAGTTVSNADRTTGDLVTGSRAELTNRSFHATHATPGSSIDRANTSPVASSSDVRSTQTPAAKISEAPANPGDPSGSTQNDLFVGTSSKGPAVSSLTLKGSEGSVTRPNAHGYPSLEVSSPTSEFSSASEVKERQRGVIVSHSPTAGDEGSSRESSVVQKTVSGPSQSDNPTFGRGVRAPLNPGSMPANKEATHEQAGIEKSQPSGIHAAAVRSTPSHGKPMDSPVQLQEVPNPARQDAIVAREVPQQADFKAVSSVRTENVVGENRPTTVQTNEQTDRHDGSTQIQNENETPGVRATKTSDSPRLLPLNEGVRQTSFDGNSHGTTPASHVLPEGVRSNEPGVTLSAPVPMLPREFTEHIIEQVSKELALRIGNRGSEIRLMLKPETLGELALKVKLEDGTMTAKIDVTQASVKAALEANLGDLRSALQSRGIEVKSIDVFAHPHFSSGESRGQHPAKSGSQGKRRWAVNASETYQATRRLGYNTIEVII